MENIRTAKTRALIENMDVILENTTDENKVDEICGSVIDVVKCKAKRRKIEINIERWINK